MRRKFDQICLIYDFIKYLTWLRLNILIQKHFLFVYFYIPLRYNKKTICFGIKYTIMGRLGLTEILVIVGIVLLLFGGKKIPELMKGLGSGIKEFKNAAKDDQTTAAKKEEEEVK